MGGIDAEVFGLGFGVEVALLLKALRNVSYYRNSLFFYSTGKEEKMSNLFAIEENNLLR